MDILSFLPIIVMILAIVSKLNKGATRTNLSPRSPFPRSSPWTQNLDTSIQKWLSSRSLAPTPEIVEIQKDYRVEEASWMDDKFETEGTPGIEGTAGIEGTEGVEGISGTEGTNKQSISSEVETPRSEERSSFPHLIEGNLAQAVIWSEILGKPRARINGPFASSYWHGKMK